MKVLWKMPVTVLNVCVLECVLESIPLRWAGSINVTCQSSYWTQNLKRQAIPHHTFKRNVCKSRSELWWGSCRTIVGAAELERCYFAKILNTSLREDLLIPGNHSLKRQLMEDTWNIFLILRCKTMFKRKHNKSF